MAQKKVVIIEDPNAYFSRPRRGKHNADDYSLAEMLEIRQALKDYDTKVEDGIKKKQEEEKKKKGAGPGLNVFERMVLLMLLSPVVGLTQIAVASWLWHYIGLNFK